jgi:hypothetical protein
MTIPGGGLRLEGLPRLGVYGGFCINFPELRIPRL